MCLQNAYDYTANSSEQKAHGEALSKIGPGKKAFK